jgi:hypothetical protein
MTSADTPSTPRFTSSARHNSISPESVCTPTGDGVRAGATAVVAFVVAFARDQYDPGMTVPRG